MGKLFHFPTVTPEEIAAVAEAAASARRQAITGRLLKAKAGLLSFGVLYDAQQLTNAPVPAFIDLYCTMEWGGAFAEVAEFYLGLIAPPEEAAP